VKTTVAIFFLPASFTRLQPAAIPVLAALSHALLVVQPCLDAHWRDIEGPRHHCSRDAAIFEGGNVSRGREILGVAAKVISDPDQLRMLHDRGPRHYGILSLVSVVFSALENGHCDFSLSCHHLKKKHTR
jgi:hypothetical protein